MTVTYLCKTYKGEIKVEKTEGRDARFYNIAEIPQNISTTVLPIINEYIKKQK
ncbi:hypothetical protein JCM19376_22340 [Fusibacter bizertensis]